MPTITFPVYVSIAPSVDFPTARQALQAVVTSAAATAPRAMSTEVKATLKITLYPTKEKAEAAHASDQGIHVRINIDENQKATIIIFNGKEPVREVLTAAENQTLRDLTLYFCYLQKYCYAFTPEGRPLVSQWLQEAFQEIESWFKAPIDDRDEWFIQSQKASITRLQITALSVGVDPCYVQQQNLFSRLDALQEKKAILTQLLSAFDYMRWLLTRNIQDKDVLPGKKDIDELLGKARQAGVATTDLLHQNEGLLLELNARARKANLSESFSAGEKLLAHPPREDDEEERSFILAVKLCQEKINLLPGVDTRSAEKEVLFKRLDAAVQAVSQRYEKRHAWEADHKEFTEQRRLGPS